MRLSTTPVPRSLIACLFSLLLAPAALAQRMSPFMQEFRKLMEIKAQDEMVALIKQHETEAVLAVIEICETISQGSNDQLEAEIDELGKAWKKAYDSKFVEYQYGYFSVTLTGPFKKHRHDLIDRFVAKYKDYAEAEKTKDVAKLPVLGLEFQDFGNRFVEIGDHYMAGQSFRVYASCFDESLMGTRADFRRAAEGWKLFVEAREACDLKNSEMALAKQRFDLLESEGYGDPSKGPEARAAARAESDAAYAPVPLNCTFALVPDIDALQRPSYCADSNYQIWTSIYLTKEGSTGTIPTMEQSPEVVRTGAAKAAVDLNGDGKGDVDIPITGKISPVQVTLGEGDQARPWGFLAVIGAQDAMYQGFKMNLAPDENQMSIYVAPAGSLVGMVNGVRVQVIDENMDGAYGSAPKDWGYIGTRDGSFQHDMDSVLIGESLIARPWSGVQKIGDLWFKLAPNESGTDIVATRTDVQTGTLELDLKGVDATWVIVRGTANQQDHFFDVFNAGTKKVEVPVGAYELYMGQVATGKKTQITKALMLAGTNSRAWRVAAGATVKVELGAPFGFDFRVIQDEKTVKVDGPSIVITGRGNESYQRLWNCVPAPEMLVRKAGSGKGKKEAKLQPASSQEQVQQDFENDFKAVWFPVGTTVDKPSEGESAEVQLFEKKNKLFGKIESDWRSN